MVAVLIERGDSKALRHLVFATLDVSILERLDEDQAGPSGPLLTEEVFPGDGAYSVCWDVTHRLNQAVVDVEAQYTNKIPLTRMGGILERRRSEAYQGTHFIFDIIKLVAVEDKAVTFVNQLNVVLNLAQIFDSNLKMNLGTLNESCGLDFIKGVPVLLSEFFVDEANCDVSVATQAGKNVNQR